MDKVLVSIYDRKAEYYLPIWPSENEMTAARQFMNLVKDSETMIKKNPEDFILFKVGTFDDKTGKVEGLHHNIELINGLNISREMEV